MQPIIATASLELLHVDFTLRWLWSLIDHQAWWTYWFSAITSWNMSWLMCTPTILQRLAKFLWQGYILIFRVPAKLHSDQGTNFASNIIKELFVLMGIWKVWTSPYHTPTNGQVAWAHQMLMHMIGKLSKDQRADWPKHLPELVHAYNSMISAITRIQPHYLMFRDQPCLSIDFYFPMIRDTEKHRCIDYYIAELCEWLWEACKEAQVQSTSEAEIQKWYYDRKANTILLETGDLVLAKANAYKGKRKVKDQWEEEQYEVECQVADGIPSYLMRNQWTGCSQVFHQNWLFHHSCKGYSPL